MLFRALNPGDLARATRGAWTTPFTARHVLTSGALCTDTRALKPGDMFLALRGERFDGHAFLGDALRAGACALVVQRGCVPTGADLPAHVPVLEVDDTLVALGDIAHEVRQRAAYQGTMVAGVAGSSGKTTTKELLASILAAEEGPGRVLSTQGNFNNLIGLPLTLLNLEPGHTRVVLEAGMNEPGELARLARIAAPDVAVFTGIGMAHMGRFASREEHFQAKLDWLLHVPAWASLVVNSDNPAALEAVRRLGNAPHDIYYVGSGHPESVARVLQLDPWGEAGHLVTFEFFGIETEAIVPFFGTYNATNLLLAATAARLMGASVDAIARGSREAALPHLRGEIHLVAGRTLVADCYNCAPDALKLSLNSACELALRSNGRVFALLADMAELGPTAPEIHRSIGQHVASLQLAGFWGLGPLMQGAVEEAQAAGIAAHPAHDVASAVPAILEASAPGDVILLKGSRLMKLEQALQYFSVAA